MQIGLATHFDHLQLGLHVFNTPPIELTSLLTSDALEVVWPRVGPSNCFFYVMFDVSFPHI